MPFFHQCKNVTKKCNKNRTKIIILRLESHYIKRKKVYKKTNINFVVLLLKANISLYFDTNVCMSFCMSLSYTLCYVNINMLEMTCDVLMLGIINNFYILPVIKDEKKSYIVFQKTYNQSFFAIYLEF